MVFFQTINLPARIIRSSSQVSAQNCAHEGERQDHKDADAGHGYHRSEGDGSARVVVDGDEVDDESGATNQDREKEGRQQHLPDPDLSAHLGVEGAAKVAVDRGRSGVHKDSR